MEMKLEEELAAADHVVFELFVDETDCRAAPVCTKYGSQQTKIGAASICGPTLDPANTVRIAQKKNKIRAVYIMNDILSSGVRVDHTASCWTHS
ncbi:hypothetical protein N7471_010423 [Penicillium samsonianum]|uniref:uncharacterized protein n=1 Tax=Penicillium samsonianum TaxID=1882272 RepID=UPI0025475B0E|nr:uncharacterized protein N7471_010423 [Penicillium samsonianum]KAJ6125930.1 hypothetical protein N7471_010423 [Penicillium samsonianum]